MARTATAKGDITAAPVDLSVKDDISFGGDSSLVSSAESSMQRTEGYEGLRIVPLFVVPAFRRPPQVRANANAVRLTGEN